MKESDIKLNNLVIQAYCKKEHRFQNQVFKKKVAQGRMTSYEANTKYYIISQLEKLVTMLEARKITWQELMVQVEAVPPSNVGKQVAFSD